LAARALARMLNQPPGDIAAGQSYAFTSLDGLVRPNGLSIRSTLTPCITAVNSSIHFHCKHLQNASYLILPPHSAETVYPFTYTVKRLSLHDVRATHGPIVFNLSSLEIQSFPPRGEFGAPLMSFGVRRSRGTG
jgi:hypothetical protein